MLSELPAPDGSADTERDFAILRIVHEALQNTLRHAEAAHVVVRLAAGGSSRSPTTGSASIRGRAELRSRHLGLTSMEERARDLGGRLEVASTAGLGTTVRLELTP